MFCSGDRGLVSSWVSWAGSCPRGRYFPCPVAGLVLCICRRLFLLLQSPVQSFRGKNLDFPLCTIPSVSLYEKYGVLRASKVAVHLALFIVVGFCDREYPAELIFELVDGLWSDHAVEACQFVSEGDQRVVRPIAFGRCHARILSFFSVGENAW
jgi:hypothetical protein